MQETVYFDKRRPSRTCVTSNARVCLVIELFSQKNSSKFSLASINLTDSVWGPRSFGLGISVHHMRQFPFQESPQNLLPRISGR